jgi:hypothetical protein
MVDDEVTEGIDTVMNGLGYSRDRKHVTGKRSGNLPDLLIYSGEDVRDSLTVGLEDHLEGDTIGMTITVTHVKTESASWNSFAEFERNVGPWITEQRERQRQKQKR